MKTSIIGLLFLLISCIEKPPRLTDESGSTKHSPIEDCDVWISDADSTLVTGDFVRYIKENGRIKIEWGNKSFIRILDRDYDCAGSPSWIPTIRWTTSKHIGLRYGCGSPCWGTIILPLNSTDSVFERMYDLQRELDRNLIVYLGGEDYDKLIIENWKSGKKQEIKPATNCESAFLGYCIDTLRFENDILYIRWGASAGNRSNQEMKVDSVKIAI